VYLVILLTMTKYYVNGPYRCPGCFQIDFAITTDGNYCRKCVSEQHQRHEIYKDSVPRKELDSETVWDKFWRLLTLH